MSMPEFPEPNPDYAKRKSRILRFLLITALTLIAALVYIFYYFNLIPGKAYYAKDFDIQVLQSTKDLNENGTDDYTDILIGAKTDAQNRPVYDGRYYGGGGYPPKNIGVCTDVVWRAFKNAGYCLRDMVDNDIKNRPDSYGEITVRDRNIDFRRVGNLRVFFEEYAEKLTLDINKIEEWQPGDIVIFGNDRHIGIVSDKRNRKGIAYIIHNGGQPKREEDYLKRGDVTGHYRFDASQINDNIIVLWYE